MPTSPCPGEPAQELRGGAAGGSSPGGGRGTQLFCRVQTGGLDGQQMRAPEPRAAHRRRARFAPCRGFGPPRRPVQARRSGSPGLHPSRSKDVAPLSDQRARAGEPGVAGVAEGGGAQGPFVGGSTDDVTPTWDQSPWASALGSRPPSSPSSVPDLEPGESQPAAQGASARVTVCVCARHRLRALPSARRRRGPFWFTFWFRYFFAPLPSQPSLRSPPPLKSHKAVCNSIFSLLNFYLIHLEVLVEILRFHS